MQSLYAITNDFRQMLDNAFDENGEALPAFEEQRALWGSKAANVTAYVLNIEAEAEQAKAAIERITEHHLKPALAKAARLRAYLRDNMQSSGITSIKASDGSFTATLYPGRDESVEVFDDKQLPQDYLREVPARYEPNKVEIKRALKEGFDVPGAKLVKRDRLTIR